MLKNLFKEEKNKDIFKIICVVVLYLVIFSIFKAGLDFQKVIPAKNYQKPEQIKEYSYEIVANSVSKKIKYNEKKSLTQILDGFFEKNIEIRILRAGSRIESIYNSKNIRVLLNGEDVNKDFISEDPITENSIIQVFY